MKKKIAIFILCIICFIVGEIPAAEREKTELDIGPEIYSYTYTEPGLMEDKGYLYGLAASYSYYGDAFFRLDGRLATGKVDYRSNGTGSMDNIDYHVFEIRGLLGKDFILAGEKVITPYLGLGYRYLLDDSGGRISSTGAGGYDRESNYYYLPVGLELFSELTDAWSEVFTLEYDYFLMGEQESHLSDANPNYNDVSNGQNDGYGWRASIRFQREYKQGAALVVEPFVRYWNIDWSDPAVITDAGTPVGIGYEPTNKTREIGIKVVWKLF